MKVYWTLCVFVCVSAFAFVLSYLFYDNESCSKRVLIVMAGFWQGRREGVIELRQANSFHFFFSTYFSLLFSSF